jgi:hypothetical protein
MRIGENRGIVVGPGGRISGGAQVTNLSHEEKKTMNNQFSGPVGVVAEAASDFTQVQNLGATRALDLATLAEELGRLRAAARQEATEGEHDVALGGIAQAESAAKKADVTSVLRHLATAGKWALDVATRIGASVAVEAIKRAMAH